MKQHRIGIGGIAIESSTFSPLLSDGDDFRVLRAGEMITRYPFMPDWSFHERRDITWLPCLHAQALPGGSVIRRVYTALKQELLARIRAALPLDGFYLDIHGAMHVQGLEDAEADLVGAIRMIVGPDCLISAGMDLHGNVSDRLVALVDLFTAYRTAPHDDVLQTRQKACANLVFCLDHRVRPVRAWVRIPAILPGERTSTLVEPGKSVYASLAESDSVQGILDASLWVGYVWADEPRSAATVVVTGTAATNVQHEAEKIARRYWSARAAFDFVVPAGSADWCIQQAMAYPGNAVVISDSGDNPTAGGVGDIPHLVGRLLAHPALARGDLHAIYASIADAAAVAACFEAGVGQAVDVALGGKLDPVHAQPLSVQGTVETLVPHDPTGGHIAVLRSGGVSIIVTTRRKPYHFIRDFASVGLDPAAHKITVVKIGYLEPELRQMARHALLALTPGAVNQDIPSLPYTRIQRPIYPLDPDFVLPDLQASLFGS